MSRKKSSSNKSGKTYTRTKFGEFMHKITVKSGLFVAHKKWLFYILAYTWALPITIAGWVILAFVRVFLKKKVVEKGQFFTAKYVIFGNHWGGLECGTNFLLADGMGKDYTLHCKCHELGHTYQAAVWGIFVLFFFYLPSVCRYWYQVIRDKKKLPNTPYDLIYFESSASEIGQTLLSEKEGKDYFYYTSEFKKNPNYGKKIKQDE